MLVGKEFHVKQSDLFLRGWDEGAALVAGAGDARDFAEVAALLMASDGSAWGDGYAAAVESAGLVTL